MIALEITIICLLVIALGFLLIIIIQLKNNKAKDNYDDIENLVKSEFSIFKSENDTKLYNTQRSISDNIDKYLELFKKSTNDKLDVLTSTLKESIDNVNKSVKENTEKIETYLNTIRETLASSIEKLQKENNDKLEEMRKTVDEKLNETLNTRLTQSFQLVQDNLLKVERGLGEMKDLANGVGDLKKVLSNVKTRGIWGEMQLSQILEQILNKDQYEENIITKPKSKDPVEFAIKLPGDGKEPILLPIDAKFPLDIYENVLDAYESADKDQVESAIIKLKQRIKGFAKDIKDKYIEPPYTTDFAIMFLPVEGLYAEVAKSGLIEELQRDFRVIIAGPTTMAALLNSLQVGFRTLAIEKRTSEVWKLLEAVKTEFKSFSDVLTRAQKKLGEASNEIETLVGTRTRQIQRKLKNVSELSLTESKEILEIEEEKE